MQIIGSLKLPGLILQTLQSVSSVVQLNHWRAREYFGRMLAGHFCIIGVDSIGIDSIAIDCIGLD